MEMLLQEIVPADKSTAADKKEDIRNIESTGDIWNTIHDFVLWRNHAEKDLQGGFLEQWRFEISSQWKGKRFLPRHFQFDCLIYLIVLPTLIVTSPFVPCKTSNSF